MPPPRPVEDQENELTCGPRVIPVVAAAAVYLDNPAIPRRDLARQELVNKFGDPKAAVFPGMRMHKGFKYIRDEGIGLEQNCTFTGMREMNVEFSPPPGPRTYIGGFRVLDNKYADVCGEIKKRPLACTVLNTPCFSNFRNKGETIYRKHNIPASILKEVADPTLVRAPTHAPAVRAPTHAPAVRAPTHAPAVPAPTHAPAVPAPTHAPAVPAPTHAPAVPAPTHAPAPQETESTKPKLHFVILAGYGSDPLTLGQKQGDGDFYVIQNSYGPDWGKEGCAKIAPDEVFGIFAPDPPYRVQ